MSHRHSSYSNSFGPCVIFLFYLVPPFSKVIRARAKVASTNTRCPSRNSSPFPKLSGTSGSLLLALYYGIYRNSVSTNLLYLFSRERSPATAGDPHSSPFCILAWATWPSVWPLCRVCWQVHSAVRGMLRSIELRSVFWRYKKRQRESALPWEDLFMSVFRPCF